MMRSRCKSLRYLVFMVYDLIARKPTLTNFSRQNGFSFLLFRLGLLWGCACGWDFCGEAEPAVLIPKSIFRMQFVKD